MDQLAKLYVIAFLNLPEVGTIDVVPPLLRFRMAWNQGVNFGLFSSDAQFTRWILVAVAIGISVWLVSWARHSGRGVVHLLAGLVVGGALANALDRVVYGAVADFLNMSCCGLNNPYAFNLADVAIFVGAFGLVVFSNGFNKTA